MNKSKGNVKLLNKYDFDHIDNISGRNSSIPVKQTKSTALSNKQRQFRDLQQRERERERERERGVGEGGGGARLPQ